MTSIDIFSLFNANSLYIFWEIRYSDSIRENLFKNKFKKKEYTIPYILNNSKYYGHTTPSYFRNHINKKKYDAKIIISDEKDLLLDTGGGIFNATRSFKKPFVAINPDTLWNEAYSNELKNLEDLYFTKKSPGLLLVNKNLSFDSSFKGDFNLYDDVISRDNSNKFIFTGLQILDQGVFISVKDKVFSMNKVWNYLIEKNSLIGKESKQKFYHLNTKEMYDKISNLRNYWLKIIVLALLSSK